MGKKQRPQRKILVPIPSADLLHGGRAGLNIGDILYPGSEVPDPTFQAFLRRVPKAEREVYQTNRVAVTTDYDLAHAYAARAGHLDRIHGIGNGSGLGAIYTVRPTLPLEVDADYPEGISYLCKRATIIDVRYSHVPGSPTAPTAAGMRFMTWDDGARRYDDKGYPLPSQVAQDLGVTGEDIRHLGYGADLDTTLRAVSEVLHRLHPDLTQEDLDRRRRDLGITTNVNNWRSTPKG